MALNFECRINKYALLQIVFLAILPTGKRRCYDDVKTVKLRWRNVVRTSCTDWVMMQSCTTNSLKKVRYIGQVHFLLTSSFCKWVSIHYWQARNRVPLERQFKYFCACVSDIYLLKGQHIASWNYIYFNIMLYFVIRNFIIHIFICVLRIRYLVSSRLGTSWCFAVLFGILLRYGAKYIYIKKVIRFYLYLVFRVWIQEIKNFRWSIGVRLFFW